MLHFSFPTLRSDASGRHFVSFQCEGRRHRFFSADILGLDIRPNKARGKERDILAQRLTVAFHSALLDGWSPRSAHALPAPDITTAFEAVTAFEPAPHLSGKYAGELRVTRQRFLAFLKKKGLDSLLLRELTQSHCLQYLKPLHTTHQDIANDLHTSRVVVSRLLKGFEKEGVLSLHRNAIEMATF